MYLVYVRMKNARTLLLFCFVSATRLFAMADPIVRVQLLVVDSLSGSPIAGVHVKATFSVASARTARSIVLVSDREGRSVLEVGANERVRLVLSHVSWNTVDRTFGAGELVDGATLRIAMLPRMVDIPEVVIRRAAPEVVFQRADLHVGDHCVTADGVWVLAYEQPQLWHRQESAGEQLFRHAALHLLDTLFREKASVALVGEVRCLYRDHRGRVVVDGRSKAWVATAPGDSIALQEVDRNLVHEALLPWTDSIAGHLLGSTRNPDWPAFDHVAYDPVADVQHSICSVEDALVMELFRSQYKYMSGPDKVVAMDLELELGVEREVIAGYMTGFHKDIYFHVPYAPLFVVRDTLCVFDHARGAIRRFTSAMVPVDEVPMKHVRQRGWSERLVQDPADDAVYALFAHGPRTVVRRLDPATGALGRQAVLAHPFPDEVQVHDGHAYYVYRPTGAVDHRTLYRETLR
jgi:hypothetical protein